MHRAETESGARTWPVAPTNGHGRGQTRSTGAAGPGPATAASQIHGLAAFDSFRGPELLGGKLMVAGEVALRRPAYDGAVVTVKCDEAGVESCGAGFAFSGSGNSRLFGRLGRSRYRILWGSHGRVVA